MNRRASGESDGGELPRTPFDLIDELSCYYDTPAEPNNVLSEVLVPGAIDYPTLRRAVAEALAAAPRARGRMAAGGALRRRYTWEFPPVPDIDPLSHTTWLDEQELLAARVRFMATSPSLRTSPPVRLLLASGPDASCVMLNAHHAAMDGISCAELLGDIAERYCVLTANPVRPGTCADRTPGAPLPSLPSLPRRPVGAPASPASSGLRMQDPAPQSRQRSPMRGWVCAVRRRFVARIAREPSRRNRRGRSDGCGLQLLRVPSAPRQSGATVNDALVAALIATISRWNAAHRRPPATIRITVPVNVRAPGQRGVVGNHTRTVTVTADPRAASQDLSVLVAAVAGQTRVIRQAGRQRAPAGAIGPAPGWCPVALKRLAVRIALRGVGSLVCDTSMLSNLGNVPDPPWSGPGGPVRMAMSSPVHMPRGLSVGAMTADGQLQLCFRYRYALFDDTAAARFVAAYAAALDELATGTAPVGLQAPAVDEEEPVILQQALLKILVCPVDKGWLLYFADEDLLYNPRLKRAYRIQRGVPVMLAERAEPVDEREHERLIARARDGAACVSAAGLARDGFAAAEPSFGYPATASGGIAGPASDGTSTPA